jgi:DnaJ-class molecular chaperone
MLQMFLEKKKISQCHSCNGQGWITEIVSRVPLKTVTDSCKRCNQDKIPNSNYRIGKLFKTQ